MINNTQRNENTSLTPGCLPRSQIMVTWTILFCKVITHHQHIMIIIDHNADQWDQTYLNNNTPAYNTEEKVTEDYTLNLTREEEHLKKICRGDMDV